MLRTDVKELLDGFAERMKFIHIVKSLTVTGVSLPDRIKTMVDGNTDLLDNLVLMTVLFIKEQTIGTEQTCTMRNVEDFLEQVRPVISEPYQEAYDPHVMADFIVSDVLQNKGKLYEYLTYDDKSETCKEQTTRLISEEKGSYHLTDDVFDFLYRSKEIESELDYSVTRFKLQEYMRRRNYTQALDQSRELVERLRNLRVSMDLFLIRCRENLTFVNKGEYQSIISRFTDLMETEYGQLNDLEKQTEREIEQAQAAVEYGADAEETEKNLKSLTEIADNLETTVREQRILINKKDEFNKSYQQIIRDNFQIRNYSRMNFEKDILRPLETHGESLNGFAGLFLSPLAKPRFPSIFSIENFYVEAKLTDTDQEEEGVVLSEVNEEQNLTEERNARFAEIMRRFFAFAMQHQTFRIHEFVKSLSVKDIFFMCEENALPRVILSLYALNVIDMDAIRAESGKAVVTEPTGEFELLMYLPYVRNEDKRMKRIVIEKTEDSTVFLVRNDTEQRTIEMTDFEIEVTV